MPPKKKRITPTLIGAVGSTIKKEKNKLIPGKKRLKQRVKSKAKPKAKRKKKSVATNEELALGILVRVCQKLSGGSKGHKKKTKAKAKAKSKGGGTKGQKTAAKKLKKLSKHYGKLKFDANPDLAF